MDGVHECAFLFVVLEPDSCEVHPTLERCQRAGLDLETVTYSNGNIGKERDNQDGSDLPLPAREDGKP